MEIGMVVRGRTIGDAWAAGRECFRSPENLYRHESSRGVAFDLPCLTLVVGEPTADTPANYEYPQVAKEYMALTAGADRESSLLYMRLFRWPARSDEPLDQVARIIQLLTRDPETRSAVFSLWRPETDLTSSFPVSPVAGSFRVLNGALHLFVVERSTDYWLGAVPDMLALALFQADVAAALGTPVGPMAFTMWSAHVYEDEYVAYLLSDGNHGTAG